MNEDRCRASSDGSSVHVFGPSLPQPGQSCDCGAMTVGADGWDAPTRLVDVSWNPYPAAGCTPKETP